MSNKRSIREAFGEALRDLGKMNDKVVVLEADVGSSTKSEYFGKAYPERYFNVGISELNMVNMAAGLALEGFIPYANTFAVFFASRALDPVQSLIAYDKLNVRLCGAYSGLSDSYDGASHQSITDISVMRSIPGMTVISVADSIMTKKAVEALAEYVGPAYIRLSRTEVEDIYEENQPFEIGKGNVLREGTDVTIISTGTVLHNVLEAAELMAAENIQVEVIDIHTIQPLDKELIIKSAEKTGAVLTVEEHSIYGGLGSAVAEVLAEKKLAKVSSLGLKEFAESGDLKQLLEKYGYSAKDIAKKAREVKNL